MAKKRQSNTLLDVKQPKIAIKELPKLKLETTELLSLNDDCLFTIFDFLSLSDFCAISKTCKRLQSLAKDQFGRKYSCKWMLWRKYKYAERKLHPQRYRQLHSNNPVIPEEMLKFTIEEINNLLKGGITNHHIETAEKLLFKLFVTDVTEFDLWKKSFAVKNEYVLPAADHLMCFYQNIKNVCVHNDISLDAAIDFLCSNSSEYNQIQFKRVFIEGKESLSTQAVNLLEKVTTIGFWKNSCKHSLNFYEYFLQYCRGLKNLIFHSFAGIEQCNWMPQKYPWLEHVQLRMNPRIKMVRYKESFPEKFRQFLQLNSIKSLTFFFEHFCSNNDEFIGILKIIVEYGTALKELFLSFELVGFTIEKHVTVEAICCELKSLCDRPGFERLEIDLGKDVQCNIKSIEKLSALEKVTGLHNVDVFRPVESIISFGNLKVLQLEYDPKNGDKIHRLAQLRHLELLVWLDGLGEPFDVAIGITPFVRYSQNIKTINVNIFDVTDDKEDIVKWNGARKKGASKLTLFFSKNVFSKLKKLLFVGIDGGDLVAAKAANIIKDVQNLENPFVNLSWEEI